MNQKKVKIIVTLGPSTNKESDLRKLKDKGVDFVRVNMSHSSIDDLKYFIELAKKVGTPFIIDTEGSQVRSGSVVGGCIDVEEGDEVKIHTADVVGDASNISLRPSRIAAQLEEGDLVYIDFGSLILRVSDVTPLQNGYIVAHALVGGSAGSNKAVVIDPVMPKQFDLPPLSEKDRQSIAIGLEEGIGYIAASFMRSAECVDVVSKATKGSMKIISKIECADALRNLDGIIEKSDFILIDRGDLSKEIPIEKIPIAQKIILHKAREKGKEVFVATNLLETMVEKPRPTRAEVHDVIATVLDGASGVALAAETAIGKYPMECVTVMNKLLKQARLITGHNAFERADYGSLVRHLEDSDYFFNHQATSLLVPPHGGVLIDRVLTEAPSKEYVDSLVTITLDDNAEMDVEQIAVGTFSPLAGFMTKHELESVLDVMRLPNGVVWTMPVVLDVSADDAERISLGDTVALADSDGVMALLHVDDKYSLDKNVFCKKLYGTTDPAHPGVLRVCSMRPVLLGGKIDLIRRRKSEFKEYALTPRQTRRLFEERGWAKIVGFHTRNVIHRSHEWMQLMALEQEYCDGLFIHPVIGQKKEGDFHARFIIKSYEHMMKRVYPKDKVVFATFSTFSRYAGPREAIFTALCRKNFGCSHFVVGRDHTGVGKFYESDASHKIFDQFPDLGITAVKFNEVFYSKKLAQHMHDDGVVFSDEGDKMRISGTEARKMFESGIEPPEWFMRPEISKILVEARNNGEEIFVGKGLGTVIWFTGLSGSGKSTIALKLKEAFESKGKRVAVLDGDRVRNERHTNLGFSKDDIYENNRLVAELARAEAFKSDFVFVPIISPYRECRAIARSIIGPSFIEVFVNAPLETCIERDVKGLYKKALAGEIPNFIGVSESNLYEIPERPDIVLNTKAENAEYCIDQLLNFLRVKQGFSL